MAPLNWKTLGVTLGASCGGSARRSCWQVARPSGEVSRARADHLNCLDRQIAEMRAARAMFETGAETRATAAECWRVYQGQVEAGENGELTALECADKKNKRRFRLITQLPLTAPVRNFRGLRAPAGHERWPRSAWPRARCASGSKRKITSSPLLRPTTRRGSRALAIARRSSTHSPRSAGTSAVSP
jgi:hypothetical protein